MKLYESAQDYLEAILIISKSKSVKAIDIARYLEVTKQSVSRAVKNLKENDFITISENSEISLTSKGLEIAEQMYDKHITLTKFFTQIGVDEVIAKKDACKVEHYISDETFNALKKMVK